MAHVVKSESQEKSFWDGFNRPPVLIALALGYIALTVLGIVTADRRNLFYFTYNIVIFSLFTISPVVVVLLPVSRRFRAITIGVLLLVIMPVMGIYNPYYLELAIQICIFAGLALGLNIVVGYAGLLDLGFIAFFAVGAYLWGMFTSNTNTIFFQNGWIVPANAFYIFFFLGLGVTAIVGIILGLPVLRLRGDYLAIVTLGFGEVIRLIARNLDSPINFTNGSQGLSGIPRPDILPGISELTLATSQFFSIRLDNLGAVSSQIWFYLLSLAVLAMVVVISRNLEESPIGRAWTAIREDEIAAIAMGVPLVRMKLTAFAFGAAIGGGGGVLYAAKQSFIDPSSFLLLASISILAMVIIGGMGNIIGVIFGAIIVTLLDLHVLSMLSQQISALKQSNFVFLGFNFNQWPSQLEPAKFQPLVFGLILVLMMLFRPAGLLPAKRRLMELSSEEVPDEEIDAEISGAKKE